MEKDRIVYPFIKAYMRHLRRERSGAIGELELRAGAEGFPIAEPETADLLEIICRLRQPSEILEIGTCIGFSALLMKSVCPKNTVIDTIERNPVMIAEAERNFAAFGYEGIRLLKGDALDILPSLELQYDLIYIDAAKGQYPTFFSEAKRLLSRDGVIIADNVLFNGYVAEGKPDCHRNKTIVTRLDEFLTELYADTSFKTVLLPISDGVTLSFRA